MLNKLEKWVANSLDNDVEFHKKLDKIIAKNFHFCKPNSRYFKFKLIKWNYIKGDE